MIVRLLLITMIVLVAMVAIAARMLTVRYTSESVEDPKIYYNHQKLLRI